MYYAVLCHSLQDGLSFCLPLLLQVPPRMQHDPYVMVLILLLWLCGGYIK